MVTEDVVHVRCRVGDSEVVGSMEVIDGRVFVRVDDAPEWPLLPMDPCTATVEL